VTDGSDAERAQRAFDAAEAQLRRVEALMSSHLNYSDIGRLNAAPVGETVKLADQTLDVLRIAHDFTPASDGSFDVTVRPMLELWKAAGLARRLPTADEIASARELVGWRHFEFADGGVRKLTDGAGIDLGGIAKKYAIDLAAEAMQQAGLDGGMVNVGGDIRVFGLSPQDRPWRIGIRDPFGEQTLAQVEIRDGSVCTSGNYERFVMIEGRRRSHIVDARTGEPADMVPSVTVVGPRALEAGLWATALSILGPDGLALMKKHNPQLEALVIAGDEHDWHAHATDGMLKIMTQVDEKLAQKLAAPAETTQAASGPASQPESQP
jgi:thiamine biosynthesis lipoprotein